MAGVDQSLGGTPHNGQCRLFIGRNSSQWPVQTGHWEELLTMASADWSLGGTPHNGQFGPVIGRNSSQWLVSPGQHPAVLADRLLPAETNGPGCRTGATPTGTSHKYPGTRLAGAGAGEGAQMS
ncbi:hypothetical protein PCASD_02126 [Puccinia coronata f. sp. avenae]|uniref:Uncharacterized protein n=1 Tax=Puccinia coronata f. sp. avenae TaxID=200324 RepID=A0A2N5VQ31_9BASI|nr:hypothetical protein PCASD_18920 [Puccinia coronata f. sp. avenae]PLW52109.1 hypothetical protein PCASD_02126 [Puccinia coronata f. sp. avenae]